MAQLLDAAKDAPWGTAEVRYPSLEEYARSVRAQAEAFLAPADEYVGLEVTAARALAESRREALCVHPTKGHRTSLRSDRVHVLVEDGVVTRAERDRPPWLAGVVPDRTW